MNIRFKNYLLLVLCLMLPMQKSYADSNAQALLKKCREKGIAVGKIGLGIGGIAASHVGLVAAFGLQAWAMNKEESSNCCNHCSYHGCKECNDVGVSIIEAYLEGMKASISMIKENSKKLVGIEKSNK